MSNTTSTGRHPGHASSCPGELEIEGDEESTTTHGQILQAIHQRHPGWSITGSSTLGQ